MKLLSTKLLVAVSLALIGVIVSACGDMAAPPPVTNIAIRPAGVPVECEQATLRSGEAGERGSASATTVVCEPYDCREGWFGHIECDPYDCSMYPTTCLSGNGGAGGGVVGGGGGGPTCSAGYQYSGGSCIPIPCDPIADPNASVDSTMMKNNS